MRCHVLWYILLGKLVQNRVNNIIELVTCSGESSEVANSAEVIRDEVDQLDWEVTDLGHGHRP